MCDVFWKRLDEMHEEALREIALAQPHLDRAGELQAEVRRLLDERDAMGKVTVND